MPKLSEDQITRIYGRCRGSVKRQLLGSGISTFDEDDIAQELAIKALGGMRNLEWKARCLTYSALKSAACDRNHVSVVDGDIAGGGSEDEDASLDVAAAIKKLKPADRTLVELWMRGNSMRELTVLAGYSPKSVGAVSNRIKSIFEDLKESLVGYGE